MFNDFKIKIVLYLEWHLKNGKKQVERKITEESLYFNNFVALYFSNLTALFSYFLNKGPTIFILH